MTGSAGAESMTGWAQLLHDVVERRLRPTGDTDLLAPSWDAGFDAAFTTVMAEMLASRLRQVTPEQFVATCRALGRDDAVLAALDQLVAERAHDAERETRLLRLRRDATVSGRLVLARLAAGETLDVGLFDPARPDLAGWAHRGDTGRRPLHRVLRVRLDDPAVGAGRLVSDTWRGAVWAEPLRTPTIPSMTPVRLGTALPDHSFLPGELTLQAPVAIVGADEALLPAPGIVGYAATMAGDVVVDAAMAGR